MDPIGAISQTSYGQSSEPTQRADQYFQGAVDNVRKNMEDFPNDLDGPISELKVLLDGKNNNEDTFENRGLVHVYKNPPNMNMAVKESLRPILGKAYFMYAKCLEDRNLECDQIDLREHFEKAARFGVVKKSETVQPVIGIETGSGSQNINQIHDDNSSDDNSSDDGSISINSDDFKVVEESYKQQGSGKIRQKTMQKKYGAASEISFSQQTVSTNAPSDILKDVKQLQSKNFETFKTICGDEVPNIENLERLYNAWPRLVSDKDNGKTALHIAVEKEQLTVVSYLIEKGANVLIESNPGDRLPIELSKKQHIVEPIASRMLAYISELDFDKEKLKTVTNLTKALKSLREVNYRMSGNQIRQFEKGLRDVVMLSKERAHDEQCCENAAHAMTLLVAAGVAFSGDDLSGIQIRDANLTNGLFDGTCFDSANLIGVNFYQSYLNETNFSNANMDGIYLDVFSESKIHQKKINAIIYDIVYGLFTASDDRYLFNGEASLQLNSFIKSVAINQQLELLATGSRNGEIQIYNLPIGGDVHASFSGHKQAVTSLNFNNEGSRLVSGGEDCTVRVWDIHEEKNERCIRGHHLGVTAVTYNLDGTKIFSASWDKTVRVWSKDGANIHTYSSFPGIIRSISLHSRDGKIAVAGQSNKVMFWNDDGECLKENSLEIESAGSIVFDPDSDDYFVSGVNHGNHFIYHVDGNGQVLHAFKEDALVNAMAINKDSGQIISGRSDGVIRTWDMNLVSATLNLGHVGPISTMALSSDDEMFVSAGTDQKLFVWDLKTGEQVQAIDIDGEPLKSVVLFSKNRYLLTILENKKVQLWNLKTGEEYEIPGVNHRSIEVSPTGDYFAAINDHKGIDVWEMVENKLTKAITVKKRSLSKGHTQVITKVLWQGNQLFSAGKDGRIVDWGDVSAAKMKLMNDINKRITGLAMNGAQFACATADRDIVVGQRDQVSDLIVLNGHEKLVNKLALVNDNYVVSSAEDGTLRLWNLETKKSTKYQTKYTMSWELTSPKSHVIVEKDERNIVVLSIPDFSPIKTISSKTYCLSPDGGYLVFSSNDNCVRLFDLKNNKEVMVLHGHTSEIVTLKTNDDGSLIISASSDGAIKIWEKKDDRWILKRNISKVPTDLFIKNVNLDGAQGLSNKIKEKLNH